MAQGLSFDVSDDGDGRAVFLLHGFPSDRFAWARVTPGLVDAGYRVLAPDQRGYSPGARPPRRRDYRVSLLAGDVLTLADRAGVDRFDVVGHDWGSVVALHLGAHHPQRVRTVTAVAAPHPAAFARSMLRSSQALRSAYMAFFQLPVLPERLLTARLYGALVRSGLDARHAQRYAARPLTGPLNWYRAALLDRSPARPVSVPTHFVHGGADRFITAAAMRLSRRWVTGPCRLTTLAGASHWIPEREPERLTELLL